MSSRKWAPGAAGVAAALFFATGLAAGSPAGRPLPQNALGLLKTRYAQEKTALDNPRYFALVDYRQPSWTPRFHLLDAETGSLVGSYVVAHGSGSDPDHDGYATEFGDEPESHMSSLGFFRTGETYQSETPGHGLSLRLVGLSDSNRNAFDRKIVIHGNWYAEPEVLAKQRKPGRSHGCLVFSNADRDAVVNKLRDGALIYAFY